MKNKSMIWPLTGLVAIFTMLTSCNKKDFLDTKPDISLVVPQTLEDYQALLDNDFLMNGLGNGPVGLTPSDGEIASDDYYIMDNAYSTLSLPNQNSYLFNTGYITTNVLSWNYPYANIAVSNVVLDGLESSTRTSQNSSQYDNIEGSALFYRSHMFYQLAQLYAPPYDASNAETLSGIPLRLHADINEDLQIGSVQGVYDRITADIKRAIPLLPDTALYKNRPSKIACYALLSRTFQTMHLYDSALLYADSALNIKNALINFNELNTSLTFPFSQVKYANNPEVIFACVMLYNPWPIIVRGATARVDSILYSSYGSNDLRKGTYFRAASPSGYRFKGSYDGKDYLFTGLATDELYLIRAECLARKGAVVESITTLNTLLQARWKEGTFVPLAALDAQKALDLVLDERRKELYFRGLRWTDLRRLNTEGYNITLHRKLNGEDYSLPPNDSRYTYPIPGDVKGYHSNW